MDAYANTEAMPATFGESGYEQVQRSGQAMSRAEEQRWLVTYAPLVKRVVRSLASHANGVLDVDDMEQLGLIGLLEALRRYGEPDEGFGSYAALRVRGAVLDELRRLDWRPRSTRQSTHKLRKVERELRRRLGREPKSDELRAELGLSQENYDELEVAAQAQSFASFDDIFAVHGAVAGVQEGPEKAVVDQATLARALLALSPRERQVVQLYYEYDLNLSQIAEVLDLTAARICQINRSALDKMRAFLLEP